MIYEILMFVGVILLLILGLWLALRFYKKKKRISLEERSPPKEILDIFNEIEQQMKGGTDENGNTKSPYSLLWEITKKRLGQEPKNRISEIAGTEQATSNRELCSELNRREDIQTRTSTKSGENKSVDSGRISKPKRTRLNSIISRARKSF